MLINDNALIHFIDNENLKFNNSPDDTKLGTLCRFPIMFNILFH